MLIYKKYFPAYQNRINPTMTVLSTSENKKTTNCELICSFLFVKIQFASLFRNFSCFIKQVIQIK